MGVIVAPPSAGSIVAKRGLIVRLAVSIRRVDPKLIAMSR